MYLHAVTSSSSCQVDTLTRRTGTEEAASLLASGAVKSFQELEKGDIKLLHLIAHLTPRRLMGTPSKNGPIKRGRIEAVAWDDNLSFNCQRDIFRVCASQVVDYWMDVKRFLQTDKNTPGGPTQDDEQDGEDAAIEAGKEDKWIEERVNRGDELLLRRAAYRNEIFYAFLENTWGSQQNEQGDPEDSEKEDLPVLDDEPPIEDASYTGESFPIG